MNDSSLDIRLTTAITDEQRHMLLGWSDDPFGINHISFHGRFKEIHLIGFENEQLVSHVGLLKDVVQVAGQPVSVAGVGAVITIPPAQRKGYAQALLQRAATYMRDTLQVEFGVLFCLPRLLPFYQKLGWQEIQSPVFIEQPEGRVLSPVLVMWLPCTSQRAWPAGPVEIGMPR
jgi:GNAT superfamily N-acetyltransferase